MSLDMNPVVRAQWCAALRSGDYQQGQKALRADDSYCCLGVLCDLAVRAGVLSEPVRGIIEAGEQWWAYDGSHDFLPRSVREWAGLAEINPEVRVRNERMWLAEVNDNGESFAEIADLIDGGAS